MSTMLQGCDLGSREPRGYSTWFRAAAKLSSTGSIKQLVVMRRKFTISGAERIAVTIRISLHPNRLR
jgi:hypothetical protein